MLRWKAWGCTGQINQAHRSHGNRAPPYGRFSLMSCVFHRLRHRWFPGLTRKASLGGSAPPDPPNLLAAVVASAGQEGPTVIALVGRCRGLRRPVFRVSSKISMSSQDDFGQGSAGSTLAMEPMLLETRGKRPRRACLICIRVWPILNILGPIVLTRLIRACKVPSMPQISSIV